MEENILNCIVFDQDCFCDMKMLVADKRQRIWKNEYLPELSEKSRCETLYSRKGIPECVSRNVAISCYDEDILRRLWMSNLVILGSAHDGLYLEKGFPILKSEEHSLINETDLDILFEYSGLEIKKELTAKCQAIETFLVPEETKFKGYFKLRIFSPALTGNSAPVYLSGKALKQRLLFHLEESNFYVSKNEYEVIEESPALGGAIDDELGVHYLDYVVAITTDGWPQVAKSFITRERESGWPGPDIIMDIQMGENLMKCIIFDQDCFYDMGMIVADKRQRMWKNEYLPELSEKSRCETLYSRKGIPPEVRRKVVISSYDYDILRQLWMSNVLLLGSSQDGLYLEKGFPVFGFNKDAVAVNESDLDILFEYRGVEIKQESPEIFFSTETFLFIENTRFEGYVRLRIFSPALKGNLTPVYFNAKALKQRLLFNLDESGFHVRKHDHEVINESPALKGNIQDELGTFGTYDLDYVVAITMEDWPKLAEAFITRDRPSGWPGPNTLSDIVRKGCRFVATAHNNCKEDYFQWRVSFATSEQILSRSLNNSQIRAFLFLKTMYQEFLSDPECLSSYMMKNVLFWAIELLPSNIWHSENILHCLKSLVDMLCTFLDRKSIPNFFLPNQNLIGHIDNQLVADLINKAHQIQNDVLGMVIKCTEGSIFQGRCDISLHLMHSKLLTESDSGKNLLVSMVCFSSYLYLRLQAIRYKFRLPSDTTEECFTKGCRSICSAIPPRAVWYFSKALQAQPVESIRFFRRHDTWELDISCMRKQVVQFWRSPVYTGIFKTVLSDQEFVTNENIDAIPEFDRFVYWVDLTCLWSGFEGIKHGHSQYLITVD